ncbi:MAG: hypothetical protein EA350_05310 [Gemmatimonadales bacterium]|nr:MAG: hypothetical protein EA350_05310 [Gemmatimonadales bacterium]
MIETIRQTAPDIAELIDGISSRVQQLSERYRPLIDRRFNGVHEEHWARVARAVAVLYPEPEADELELWSVLELHYSFGPPVSAIEVREVVRQAGKQADLALDCWYKSKGPADESRDLGIHLWAWTHHNRYREDAAAVVRYMKGIPEPMTREELEEVLGRSLSERRNDSPGRGRAR